MSEALIKQIQQLPVASMSDMATVGDMLAKTGMFGTNNPNEGFVIAAMCHQEGISFIKYMQTYHLIKGKVSKRADAIQADFQRGGGKLKIIQRDAEGAVVELEKEGAKFKSACMWKDCLLEPFVYKGGADDLKKPEAQRVIKENYSTPRKRMQMMWARAISDGVRTVDASSVHGCYTPEEIEDFDDERRGVHADLVKIDAAEAAKRVEEAAATTTAFNNPATTSTRNVSQRRATADNEPTPFEMIDKPAASVDVSVCPVPGPMFGKPWADMPLEHLKAAETLTNAEMTTGHIEAIRKRMWELTNGGTK